MNKYICFIILLVIGSSLSAKTFELVSKAPNSKPLTFSKPVIDMIQKDGFTRLTTPEKGSTIDVGMPELPVFTSFFQMEPGISYNVDYAIISSHLIDHIEIYPYQGEPIIRLERLFIKDLNFYNLNSPLNFFL